MRTAPWMSLPLRKEDKPMRVRMEQMLSTMSCSGEGQVQTAPMQILPPPQTPESPETQADPGGRPSTVAMQRPWVDLVPEGQMQNPLVQTLLPPQLS